MAWLEGWQYRRKITVTNSSGADVADYQIVIDLDSNNFDFSKANADGSDIRFTEDDGQTLLSYWVEEWDSENGKAKVWVKVPSILANSSVDIYMYYGNSSVEGLSNGNETFDFFDDFEGSSLDSNKWKESEHYDLNASVSVANSIFKLTGVNASYATGKSKGYFSTVDFSPNRRLRAKVTEENNCNGEITALGFLLYPLSWWTVEPREYGVAYMGGSGSGSSGSRSCHFKVCNSSDGSDVITEKFTTPIIMEIKWTSSSAYLEYSDGNSYNITSNIPTDNLPVGIFTGSGWASGCTPVIAVDWIAVTKIAELSYTIGSEEIPASNYVQTLSEISSLSDFKILNSNSILIGNVSLSDFSLNKPVKAIIGGIYLNDERKSNVTFLLQKENINSSDNWKVNLSHTILEYTSIFDKISKSFSTLLKDSFSFIDNYFLTTDWNLRFIENCQVNDRKELFSRINFFSYVNITDTKEGKGEIKILEKISMFDTTFRSFSTFLKDVFSIFDNCEKCVNMNRVFETFSIIELERSSQINSYREESIDIFESALKNCYVTFGEGVNCEDVFSRVVFFQKAVNEIIDLIDLKVLFDILFSREEFIDLRDEMKRGVSISFFEIIRTKDLINALFLQLVKLVESLNIRETKVFSNIFVEKSEKSELKDIIDKHLFTVFVEKTSLLDTIHGFIEKLAFLVEKISIRDIQKSMNIHNFRIESIGSIDNLVRDVFKREICKVYLQERVKKDESLVKNEFLNMHDSKLFDIHVPFAEKVDIYWNEERNISSFRFEELVLKELVFKNLFISLIEDSTIRDFIKRIGAFSLVFLEKVNVETFFGSLRKFLLIEKMMINSLIGMRTNVGKSLEENSEIKDNLANYRKV